jgi:ATP-dependent Lhr-like helicase
VSVFSRFPARLQAAIANRLGWTSLRPVQEQAGHAILDGKNAVVLAPTAGGKTEASMFPVLANLIDRPTTVESVRALYIAPIKALLNNQADRLGLYTEMVGLDRFLWHGDVGQSARKQFLREPTDLLMTTPESLEVMLVSSKVPTPRLFRDLRFVVIDEVHALAGQDRGAHLMSVLERLARFTGNDVQRIGLSATVGNPEAILSWLQGTSRRPGIVVDPPKPPARRKLLVHLDASVGALADRAAARATGHKSLFFCESRALTEIIAERLRDRGTDVFVHHSSVSLEERELAEERFQSGGNASIVCTSTLELGIDVGDLDLVFQTNAPSTVSSFMQRMGRTGRRKDTVANTTFFCDDPESVLQATALIELAREGWVESVPPQTRCWPALVHQLLAMTLQFGGVSRANFWDQLSRVPDFSGVSREELDEVLDHMLERDFLYEAGGLLSMGDRAERVYGRKNFFELYAVFSSPQYYRVFTQAEKEIGTLEQKFVDGLVEEMTSFLLGGRAWLVHEISHRQRTVKVIPAPRGKKPSWGGFVPKMLSFELCQRIKRLLVESTEHSYLTDDARMMFEEYRADFAELLRRTGHAIQHDDSGHALWWTFAGGQINHTLKYALAEMTGWKIVADNWHLRIEGDGVSHGSVEEAIVSLGVPAFWDDLELWRRIVAKVPPYRLSKFQPALPPRFEQEMLGRYLLDIEGTRRFILGDGVLGGAADLLRAVLARGIPVQPPELEPEIVGDVARPENEVRYVDTQAQLEVLCRDLSAQDALGLDVETTLVDRDLCVIQFSTPAYNAVIDALAVDDLTPVAEILENPAILKIIHNANFELGVFQKLNIGIESIFDTLRVSRELRGRKIDGGHSLGVVCERELGRGLDKGEQTSDWRRRPLSASQLAYAAMDVEVLLRLHERFRGEMLL